MVMCDGVCSRRGDLQVLCTKPRVGRKGDEHALPWGSTHFETHVESWGPTVSAQWNFGICSPLAFQIPTKPTYRIYD